MKAIMYGAGNIGRGFIGKRFSLSGWNVTFVDINEAVVEQLKKDGGYPVYVTRGNEYVKSLPPWPSRGERQEATSLSASRGPCACFFASSPVRWTPIWA